MKSSMLKIKSHIDASLHHSEVGSLDEEQEKTRKLKQRYSPYLGRFVQKISEL